MTPIKNAAIQHEYMERNSSLPDISKLPADRIGACLLAVIESALDGVLVVDQTRRIVLSNAEAERIFDHPSGRIVGQTMDDVLRLASADRHAGMDRYFAARENGKTFVKLKTRLRGVRASGEEFNLDATVSRTVIQGEPLLTVVFHETLRQNGVASVIGAYSMSGRALAQDVSEIEKKRLSKQLYDDLGQRLSVLKLDMDWLESSLPNANKLCPSRVAQMQELLDNIIFCTKAIASNLRPPLLDDFGLLPAIHWVAEMFQKRTSIRCAVKSDSVAIRIGHPIESAVFRVVQEGLLNIERHARATCASVNLKQTDKNFEVLISDDGIGMASECLNKIGCFGLIAMQERIYTLGGTMSIGNIQPSGVTIHASIPLSTLSSHR